MNWHKRVKVKILIEIYWNGTPWRDLNQYIFFYFVVNFQEKQTLCIIYSMFYGAKADYRRFVYVFYVIQNPSYI